MRIKHEWTVWWVSNGRLLYPTIIQMRLLDRSFDDEVTVWTLDLALSIGKPIPRDYLWSRGNYLASIDLVHHSSSLTSRKSTLEEKVVLCLLPMLRAFWKVLPCISEMSTICSLFHCAPFFRVSRKFQRTLGRMRVIHLHPVRLCPALFGGTPRFTSSKLCIPLRPVQFRPSPSDRTPSMFDKQVGYLWMLHTPSMLPRCAQCMKKIYMLSWLSYARIEGVEK